MRLIFQEHRLQPILRPLPHFQQLGMPVDPFVKETLEFFFLLLQFFARSDHKLTISCFVGRLKIVP